MDIMADISKQLKERVSQVFKYKKLNVNSASRILGIPQRTLNRQVNEEGKVGMELIYAIMNNFSDISSEWLISGEGEMLSSQKDALSLADASPYYEELPVSAGLRDSFDPSKEAASGYISMPRWRVSASMAPMA